MVLWKLFLSDLILDLLINLEYFYLISLADGIFPSYKRFAACAATGSRPIVATANTLSPLKKIT